MKRYWSDDHIALYLGDFRDVLPALNLTPDLVLVDPPYGETSLAWDHWPDGWPATMPGRSMWCFGSMRMFLGQRDQFAGWKLSQDVVWEKHNGSGSAADRFKRVHEHVLHWYRGDWSDVYHDTPVSYDAAKRRINQRNIKPAHTGDIGASGVYSTEDGGPRLMRSVMFARAVRINAISETEKPPGLLEHLIGYGCPPGGLVVDPMAGSCSSLVAARASGRRAIGIELREEQCALAVEHRLSQAVLPFGGVPA